MHTAEDVTRHIARAGIMSATAPELARYYLATLHANAVRGVEIDRQYNRGDFGRRHSIEAGERAASAYSDAFICLGLGQDLVDDDAPSPSVAPPRDGDAERPCQSGDVAPAGLTEL